MPGATAAIGESTCPDSVEAATSFQLEDFGASAAVPTVTDSDRGLVVLRLEMGQTRMRAVEAERLNQGAVVRLDQTASDPVNVYADGRLVARGDLIVQENRFCVRLTEVMPEQTG
jgi:flagellar motor switch protein FliN